MADSSRNTLHVGKVPEFRAWLVAQRYTILPPVGPWEVLRWRGDPGRPMPIVFRRIEGNTEHYTTNGEAQRFVRRWLRERKEG